MDNERSNCYNEANNSEQSPGLSAKRRRKSLQERLEEQEKRKIRELKKLSDCWSFRSITTKGPRNRSATNCPKLPDEFVSSDCNFDEEETPSKSETDKRNDDGASDENSCQKSAIVSYQGHITSQDSEKILTNPEVNFEALDTSSLRFQPLQDSGKKRGRKKGWKKLKEGYDEDTEDLEKNALTRVTSDEGINLTPEQVKDFIQVRRKKLRSEVSSKELWEGFPVDIKLPRLKIMKTKKDREVTDGICDKNTTSGDRYNCEMLYGDLNNNMDQEAYDSGKMINEFCNQSMKSQCAPIEVSKCTPQVTGAQCTPTSSERSNKESESSLFTNIRSKLQCTPEVNKTDSQQCSFTHCVSERKRNQPSPSLAGCIRKTEVTPRGKNMKSLSTPGVSDLNVFTRLKAKSAEKSGRKISREELFKSLPEPSPRKRKQTTTDLLEDMRLAKSACTLWASECRRRFQQEHPNASSKQLDEKMRVAWERLPRRQKLVYFVRAKTAIEDRQTIQVARAAKQQKQQQLKNIHKQDGRDLQAVSVEIFDSLSNTEQDNLLKCRLGKLETQLSQQQYSTFLRSFYQKYRVELAKMCPDADKNSTRGHDLARKVLYRSICEAEGHVLDIKLERAAHYRNSLLQKYQTIVQCMIQEQNESVIPNGNTDQSGHGEVGQDESYKDQSEIGQIGTDKGKSGPSSELGQVQSHKDESRHRELGQFCEDKDQSGHKELGQVEIEKSKEQVCEKEFNASAAGQSEHCSINQANININQTKCHKVGQVVDCNQSEDLCHSERLCMTLQGLSETTEEGGSGDSNSNNDTQAINRIIQNLEHGSLTGIIHINMNGEIWNIPNVVNRVDYKSLLFDAVTSDLPVLNANKVGQYLDCLSDNDVVMSDSDHSDWIVGMETNSQLSDMHVDYFESPENFLNDLVIQSQI